jgi:uncharacterized membrane protein
MVAQSLALERGTSWVNDLSERQGDASLAPAAGVNAKGKHDVDHAANHRAAAMALRRMRTVPEADDDERPSERSGLTMEQSALLRRVGHISLERNPALLEHAEQRAESVQNRIADQITSFAGSMWFVYIHIIWFSCWIGFGVEKYPYGLLTMIVSLEAIFLSTFVMISQNRADAKRQVIADQQWQTVKEEDKQNEELLDLSNQILKLTKAIHSFTSPGSDQTEKAAP